MDAWGECIVIGVALVATGFAFGLWAGVVASRPVEPEPCSDFNGD